ncbi:amino acid (threonine) efflux protein (plasmid) [Ralstonia solanacearum P673]|uniref:Putative amino acid (Threonine) efflux protein n=1 Tax=Ralstonia solanacearum (strain Po82) TaxID=1031711 RepID=F6GBH0_RALS8|nr:putative amino acid (threonine) efflux protein [Ralstonia solanacearum Po82]
MPQPRRSHFASGTLRHALLARQRTATRITGAIPIGLGVVLSAARLA